MRVCEWLRYRRLRARVMATYIRRRSSSRPPWSLMAFSCGNRPSSMPPMNTASNSSPLEACTVISCTASCPAWAWLSPASSAAWVRKAARGERVSPVSASRMPGTAGAMGASGSRPWLAGLCVRGLPCSSSGKATASRPKPSCVTKLSAALTSSSRFSMRSWPSFSVRKCSIRPLASSICSMMRRRFRPCVCSRSTSTMATNAPRLAPALPGTALTASCSEQPEARGGARSTPMLGAPAPRRGGVGTRGGAGWGGGEVEKGGEGGVVVRVLQQAQVGQRMLDLGALKKAQAAVHAVGHGGVEQRGFDHAALRVAAVEHGDLLALETVVLHQLLDLVHHPLRFGEVARGLVHAHRLACTLGGAQVLAQAPGVVADEVVGRVEDVAVAAVVLLQLDLLLHVELTHEVLHVAHARTAKGVDALVVIAHGDHAAVRLEAAVHLVTRELLEPQVLQAVGVLELVHQDVREAPLVVRADGVVVAQQFVAAQHQLAEINHALALALVFVELVDLDLLARIRVLPLHVARAQALFLATGNEILQLLGRKALVVHVVLLAQALDGRELVLRVQDLEGLRQARRLVVRAQQTVAQAMKGADPHAAHVHRQHGGQPRHHLLGGLVGEGDGQDAAGRGLAGREQPGDARGEHARLARTGAGQDERMARRQGDGSELLGVERLEHGRFGHGTIVGSPAPESAVEPLR